MIAAEIQEWLRSRRCSLMCQMEGDKFLVRITNQYRNLLQTTGISSDLGEAIRLAQIDYDAITMRKAAP